MRIKWCFSRLYTGVTLSYNVIEGVTVMWWTSDSPPAAALLLRLSDLEPYGVDY
jgi:hypothetical protein